MPLNLNQTPFLDLLIKTNTIPKYFQTLILQYVFQDGLIQHDFINLIHTLFMHNQPIPFANVHKELVIKHSKILNTKLNQYVNTWSHLLGLSDYPTYDFMSILINILTARDLANRKQAFQIYQPYQNQDLPMDVANYFKISEQIESTLIIQCQTKR